MGALEGALGDGCTFALLGAVHCACRQYTPQPAATRSGGWRPRQLADASSVRRLSRPTRPAAWYVARQDAERQAVLETFQTLDPSSQWEAATHLQGTPPCAERHPPCRTASTSCSSLAAQPGPDRWPRRKAAQVSRRTLLLLWASGCGRSSASRAPSYSTTGTDLAQAEVLKVLIMGHVATLAHAELFEGLLQLPLPVTFPGTNTCPA